MVCKNLNVCVCKGNFYWNKAIFIDISKGIFVLQL